MINRATSRTQERASKKPRNHHPTAAAASAVTVNYATVNGTASAGSEFMETKGTLTFVPGETKKTVTVAVTGNAPQNHDADYFLTLNSPTHAVIADGVGMGTIRARNAKGDDIGKK